MTLFYLSFCKGDSDVSDFAKYLSQILHRRMRVAHMKFRPHRAQLDESMAEVVVLPDHAALVAHLANDLKRWGYQLNETDVRVEPYVYDDRIGWDTHIVTIRNQQVSPGVWFFGAHVGPDFFGAIGFTDGPAHASRS